MAIETYLKKLFYGELTLDEKIQEIMTWGSKQVLEISKQGMVDTIRYQQDLLKKLTKDPHDEQAIKHYNKLGEVLESQLREYRCLADQFSL